jgi:hypothetical protein
LSEKITRRTRAFVLEFHIEGGIPIGHGVHRSYCINAAISTLLKGVNSARPMSGCRQHIAISKPA